MDTLDGLKHACAARRYAALVSGMGLWLTVALGALISPVCAAPLGSPTGAASPAPITIAIIPGGAADSTPPPDVLMAQLEVAYGQVQVDRRPVRLVERARVNSLLNEQHLSLAGVGDPAAMVRAGHLIAADLLVFVEQAPAGAAGNDKLAEQRIVEAATGVVLDDRFISEGDFNGDIHGLSNALRAAIRVSLVPAAQRRYVGLLGFQTEELGPGLDGPAAALGALFLYDIRALPGPGAGPAVIPLERRRLQQLREEKTLTDIDQQLKSSAVLVTGGLATNPAKDRWQITLRLTRLQDNQTRVLTIDSAAGDVPAARRAIVVALAKEWSGAASDAPTGVPPATAPPAPGDVAAEAVQFARRARQLRGGKQAMEAIDAAEAAEALAPSPENEDALSNACFEVALPNPDYRSAMSAAQVRLFSHGAQMQSLVLADTLRRQGPSRADPDQFGVPGLQLHPFDPGNPGEQELFDQAFAMVLEIDARYLALHSGATGAPAARYFAHDKLILSALAYFNDPARLMAFLKPVILDKEQLIISGAQRPKAGLWFVAIVRLIFEDEESSRLRNMRVPLGDLKPLADWLAEQPDPMLRVAGLVGLGMARPDAHGAAAKALHIAVLEIPVHRMYGGEFPVDDTQDKALEPWKMGLGCCVTERANLAFASALIESICRVNPDPYFLEQDLRDLVGPVNQSLRPGCCEFLLLAMQRNIARPLSMYPERFDRALALMSSGFRKEFEPLVRKHRAWVEYWRPDADGMWHDRRPAGGWNLPEPAASAGPGTGTDPWSGYELYAVRRTPADTPGGLGTSFQVFNTGSALFWLYGHSDNEVRDGRFHETLTVTRSRPEAGAPAVVGTMEVSQRADQTYRGTLNRYGEGFPQWRLAASDRAVYGVVPHSRVGLMVFDGGRTGVHNSTNGLPSNQVFDVAFLDGAVYISVGGDDTPAGALVRMDPDSGKMAVVCSSRSVGGKTALDGGEPYAIAAMVGVPEQHCLWMKVGSADHGRAGMWRYTPGDGKFWRPQEYPQWHWSQPMVTDLTNGLLINEAFFRSGNWIVAGRNAYFDIQKCRWSEMEAVQRAAIPFSCPSLMEPYLLNERDAIEAAPWGIHLHRKAAAGPAQDYLLAPVAGLEKIPFNIPGAGAGAGKQATFDAAEAMNIGAFGSGIMLWAMANDRCFVLTPKGKKPAGLPLEGPIALHSASTGKAPVGAAGR